jgi:hypothetical protein
MFSKFNLFLGAIFAIYVLCISRYIGKKDSIFYSNFYKLILLIGVLVIYPYHKQAGVILLIIVMVTHMPMFREKFTSAPTSEPTPTPTQTINGILTGSGIVPKNKLENRESNYDITIAKRKKVEKEQPRFDILKQENIMTPLEVNIISDIQRQFDDQINIITTDDFDKIAKYTDEGDPINAGLLPRIIDRSGIDYDQLVIAGKIIDL